MKIKITKGAFLFGKQWMRVETPLSPAGVELPTNLPEGDYEVVVPKNAFEGAECTGEGMDDHEHMVTCNCSNRGDTPWYRAAVYAVTELSK